MYLVMLRHDMDDIPIALFIERDAAEEYAKSVEQMPTRNIRKIFKTDCSTPLGVSVAEFSQECTLAKDDGMAPISCENVRWFSDENDAREAAQAAAKNDNP